MKPEYLLEDEEREPFFRDAGLRLGLHPVLVEKDFWVCWMLQTLFGQAEISNHLIFKGGTSLSKVFKVINRFSEDIDLGLTPDFAGISEEVVESAVSRTQRVQWMARMQEKCGEVIQARILDGLEAAMRKTLGPKPGGKSWLEYQLDEDTHSDFAALWRHPCRDACLDRLDLLERVALHKSRYFGNAWTNYENAKPDQLRLSPPENRLGELALDYEKMKGMFTEDPPPLATISAAPTEAEERINRL